MNESADRIPRSGSFHGCPPDIARRLLASRASRNAKAPRMPRFTALATMSGVPTPPPGFPPGESPEPPPPIAPPGNPPLPDPPAPVPRPAQPPSEIPGIPSLPEAPVIDPMPEPVPPMVMRGRAALARHLAWP